MAESLGARIKHAWNAFTNPNTDNYSGPSYAGAFNRRPDRTHTSYTNDKSLLSSIYNRISIDFASVQVNHVRVDEDDRYLETIKSGLNNCLTVEANKDQAATAFRQDWVLSLFEEGTICVFPVETSISPKVSGGYDIFDMRIGVVKQFFPEDVLVSVFNEKTGERQEIKVPKKIVAIAENPFYTVMNEPNSTLKRLTRKLALLDSVDEASSSGKLDIIIQLPYTIKSETKRQAAEQRTKDIEMQMKGSTYGIAYADSTEKIVQLNRPTENGLLKQIEYLTGLLFNQLGLTEEVFNGTADEKTMLNYYNRTVEPLLTTFVESMRRTFLTKTARTQGQSIMFFRDPFKLVDVATIAEIADKFTRNEIMSANEIRSIVGRKPVKDPDADKLRNKNLPVADEPPTPPSADEPKSAPPIDDEER